MVVQKVLVANRGEISCRIQKACKKLGIKAVAVFTEPDALSLHVLRASESVFLGTNPKSYLDAKLLVDVALSTGCQAIAPGYGFLSESVEFSALCQENGLIFVGPTADTMEMFAQKHTARALAEKAQVPVLPGSSLLENEEEAVQAATAIGLPILLKATGGGGGIGIHICHTLEQVVQNFRVSAKQGAAAFGNAGVFVEKYVERARHIEIQIFGDGLGNIITFPERECSIQRRHQKVVEESPSPFVQPAQRTKLQEAAKRLGQLAKYRSAGTVEFIVDDATEEFYFLEVNTRLQVEHGITEMVAGVDLVAWQLELAGVDSRHHLPADFAAYTSQHEGHAIEIRLCAEDPAHDYRPCTGTLGFVSFPDSIRTDTWIETGVTVSPYYDNLLAKMMVHGATREEATKNMVEALAQTQLMGVVTNLEYCQAILTDPRFAAGQTLTSFLKTMDFHPHAVEVLDAGLQTTVQDYPGRVAMWSVGVPPSGPMDAVSHRFANALVGNSNEAAALEVTLTGPTLLFHVETIAAVCGASVHVTVEGQTVPTWTSFTVKRGQRLQVHSTTDGSRAYIAIAGGIDVPVYLGSRSTFPGGALGGHQGRPLTAGDMLFIKPVELTSRKVGCSVPGSWRPVFCGGGSWQIGVLPGPQAAPDYFTEQDIVDFYSSAYKVHHNSNRLGIRLEGPKPSFARTDGGEGGSHPSNVHDHVYAIGTINYTGDMPIALMVDGPSLGGFVCPATITSAQLWKMGQVRPGDEVRFQQLTLEQAYSHRFLLDKQIEFVTAMASSKLSVAEAEEQFSTFTAHVPPMPPTQALLLSVPAANGRPAVQYRLAGDRYLFVEYGDMVLDFNLRVRVQELQNYLAPRAAEGIVETSPGVRSVLIEYNPDKLLIPELLKMCQTAEANLLATDNVMLPTRILHLPLAFNERWTHEAITRYMRSVRSKAPYLPSNVEFIAKNNGLEGDPIEAVRSVVFQASYMVFGLGDVYLGAPCAVPKDPRHRLVVPKYNPARTYTPEGGVGIGGCYMCIYPMASPGGYQLVGRTLPIWNSFGRTAPFTPDKPWLLRNFDEVRFFEVTEEELERMRQDFKNGRYHISIEESVFKMHEYNEFMATVGAEYEEMRVKQRAAMEAVAAQEAADAEHAALTGQSADQHDASDAGVEEEEFEVEPSHVSVPAGVTGTVWEVKAEPGATINAGDVLVTLEAMKMEYSVTSPVTGIIKRVNSRPGSMVSQGAPLVIVEPLQA